MPVKIQAMSGKLETKLFCDFFLQTLDFFILKFHDLAAIQTNQMVVVVIWRTSITSPLAGASVNVSTQVGSVPETE